MRRRLTTTTPSLSAKDRLLLVALPFSRSAPGAVPDGGPEHCGITRRFCVKARIAGMLSAIFPRLPLACAAERQQGWLSSSVYVDPVAMGLSLA